MTSVDYVFCAKHIHEALVQLINNGLAKFAVTSLPNITCATQYPVAVLFARGDRGGDGDKLAQQAVSSFHYWNDDSGSAIDFIFVGWHKKTEGQLTFDRKDFLDFRLEFEGMCDWEYSGETDLLIMNFELNPSAKSGRFVFEEVICLPLEDMLREKLISSIDGFVSQIISAARESDRENRDINDSPAWIISDKLAIRQGKKDLWDSILRFIFRDYASKLKGLGHLAVRNLESPYGKRYFEIPESPIVIV